MKKQFVQHHSQQDNNYTVNIKAEYEKKRN